MPASVTQIGGGAFFGCSKELRLYGAEDAPAAQYARLNGLTFDFQSWKDDEELVLREEEDGTLRSFDKKEVSCVHAIEDWDDGIEDDDGLDDDGNSLEI